MLAEGFLAALLYRQEATPNTWNTERADRLRPESAPEADSNQEADALLQGLEAGPPAAGLLIPGCDFTVCLDDCSLLDQYPDLQVADSGRISHTLLRANIPVPHTSAHPEAARQSEAASSVPDQGYLVMGASVNISTELPRLEPMSNSVLNGLLEKQLEEVYMQHLTDNLARCDSQLENSLLRGLVPPLPPGGHLHFLEESLGQGSRVNSGCKGNYVSAHNLLPCSSTFSSPVLRISEADGT